MTFGTAFWVTYLIALIFYGFRNWGGNNWQAAGGDLVLAFLLGLLGWKVFGAPLH